MRIPKTVKIGQHIYKVELCNADEIQKDCGECNRATLTIKIRKDLPKTAKEETFFHEAIHAMNGGLSETMVDFLSMSLYNFLTENKLLK